MRDLLQGAVKARLNIVISGGTGSGKTTLLNVLSRFISDKERIVTVEDSAELQVKQQHVVRLECRPPNVEGKGAVMQRQLVINCLRMRPDRIIVGEVRGEEALDMLQAMNTGHDGSLTTIHANSPRDAIARMETMALMANLNLPEKAVRQQIASAVHSDCSGFALERRHPAGDSSQRDHRHGSGRRQHAGYLRFRETGSWAGGPCVGNLYSDRYPPEICGEAESVGHCGSGIDVRTVGERLSGYLS